MCNSLAINKYCSSETCDLMIMQNKWEFKLAEFNELIHALMDISILCNCEPHFRIIVFYSIIGEKRSHE